MTFAKQTKHIANLYFSEGRTSFNCSKISYNQILQSIKKFFLNIPQTLVFKIKKSTNQSLMFPDSYGKNTLCTQIWMTN